MDKGCGRQIGADVVHAVAHTCPQCAAVVCGGGEGAARMEEREFGDGGVELVAAACVEVGEAR